MNDQLIDLRSDTVTRPSSAMRAAMADAVVGDDVYGQDPTVGELERRVAALLGHEAGLFCPTGSMANQVGLATLAGPGQEVLADHRAHIVRAELGALAAMSGITTRTWVSRDGVIDPDLVMSLAEPAAGPHLVSTAAISVENTHNFAGGRVQPFDLMQQLSDAARPSMSLHLDGARLWNAHVATGVPLVDYGRLFDTVSVCLSKGLGAPVGSVLVSDADRIARARVIRKRFGGGMRQVGILAAAGLVALDGIADLAADHAAARSLALDCSTGAPVVDPALVETNIVPLDLSVSPWSAAALAEAARERGVLVSVLGPQRARLVTHRDVTGPDIRTAGGVLAELLARQS